MVTRLRSLLLMLCVAASWLAIPARSAVEATSVDSPATADTAGRKDGLRARYRLLRYLRRPHEARFLGLTEATRCVYAGTSHSDERRICIQENWVHWVLGQVYQPLSRTQNSWRLADGGFANCSERAQILKTILEQRGYPCRFVGLTGHVVLEVLAVDGWRVADPDYGVVYPGNLATLEGPRGPALIRQRLAENGCDQATIERYIEFVRTTDNNIVLPVGSPLSPRLYVIEAYCEWLKWGIPAAIAVFVPLASVRRNRRAVGLQPVRMWNQGLAASVGFATSAVSTAAVAEAGASGLGSGASGLGSGATHLLASSSGTEALQMANTSLTST